MGIILISFIYFSITGLLLLWYYYAENNTWALRLNAKEKGLWKKVILGGVKGGLMSNRKTSIIADALINDTEESSRSKNDILVPEYYRLLGICILIPMFFPLLYVSLNYNELGSFIVKLFYNIPVDSHLFISSSYVLLSSGLILIISGALISAMIMILIVLLFPRTVPFFAWINYRAISFNKKTKWNDMRRLSQSVLTEYYKANPFVGMKMFVFASAIGFLISAPLVIASIDTYTTISIAGVQNNRFLSLKEDRYAWADIQLIDISFSTRIRDEETLVEGHVSFKSSNDKTVVVLPDDRDATTYVQLSPIIELAKQRGVKIDYRPPTARERQIVSKSLAKFINEIEN